MFFQTIDLAPNDPLLELKQAFDNDPRKDKVDLSVGFYRDSDLSARLFPTVFEAQQTVGNSETKATYLPIEGSPAFIEYYGTLVFGKQILAKRLRDKPMVYKLMYQHLQDI